MLESAIQTGKRDGMLNLDDDLQRLVKAGRIALATARRLAKQPDAIVGTPNGWT
jgi:Tfp pilus assembly pilus retraction ATPase PilT